MKTQRLFTILGVTFLINAIFIFILFYYNPPHRKLKIDIATDRGISWDTDGNQLAYYSKKNNLFEINKYNFDSQTSHSVSPQSTFDISSSLGFSPDDKYISYFKQENSQKSIDIFDIKNKKSVLREVFSEKQNLLSTDNGGPKSAVSWLDNQQIIYESSISFERVGLSLVDIASGEEKKFIPFGRRPSLSPGKKYLAYASNNQDENYSIYKTNLETNETEILTKSISSYIFNLSWSPDGEMIAISYLDKTEHTLNRITVIDNKGVIISENLQDYSSPKWFAENFLLLTKFENEGVIIPSKTISGLYLYDIKNNTTQRISRRVRSENYYPRPNTNQVVYQFKNNLEIIDVNRILAPRGIDALRNKLGIIAR